MAHVPLTPIGDPLARIADERTFGEHRDAMVELEERLRKRRVEVHAGWGEKYIERVHKKGKLTARERIARLIDPDTDVFEVGTMATRSSICSGPNFAKAIFPSCARRCSEMSRSAMILMRETRALRYAG